MKKTLTDEIIDKVISTPGFNAAALKKLYPQYDTKAARRRLEYARKGPPIGKRLVDGAEDAIVDAIMQFTGVAAWIRSQLPAKPELSADEVIARFPGLRKASRSTVRNYLSRARGNKTPSLPEDKTPFKQKPEEKPLPEAKTFEEEKQVRNNDFWKEQYNTARGKLDKALKEVVLVDRLVDIAREVAPLAYTPLPRVIDTPKFGGGSSQSAVLLFSDTHIGQVIDTQQTMGFGGYDFPIFLARLKFLEERVISICKEHTNTRLDELVVCMLGDMIHGALTHSSEADQHSTKFSQFYAAGHAIAQFFRNLAPHFPKLRVVTTVGNHPRWDNQHKMPTVNRYSNLDQFLYAYVAALVRDVGNIEFPLRCEPFQVTEVQNTIIHASHGDHWKGGDKALGIPNHSIGRQLSTTAQLFAKHNKATPNLYVTGHWHRHIEIPHATGSVIINGGFPGLDGYALTANFNPVDPSQTLFFVHPKYGRTSSYDVQLKFAELGLGSPYDIPDQDHFPIE